MNKFKTGDLVRDRASGLNMVVLDREDFLKFNSEDKRPYNGWVICARLADFNDYRLHHIPEYALEMV